MVAEAPDFQASAQDTVAVIHHQADADVVIVSTVLTIEGGPGKVEINERLTVLPDDEGRYRVDLSVPESQVRKDGAWVVTVLLAAGARHLGDDPDVAALEPPRTGGRPILMWTGKADPILPVLWDYVRP